MTISSATSTVQAIFALHVATAGLAFLLLVGAGIIFLGQLKSGSARPGGFKRGSLRGSTARSHSSLGTHFWLMSGLFNLMVAYAAQATVVALQTRISSPFSITSAYSYPSYGFNGNAAGDGRYSKDISILSFLYQFASILLNVSIVGAIWMYANHLECNATRMKAPGILSWILNLFWLAAILGLGFASWGLAFIARGTGANALYYLSTLSTSFLARTLYVSYLAVVIAASTSATLEAFLCLTGAKKNGVIGNRVTKTLASFVFLVLPIIWARNAFSIAQAVILYRRVNSFSRTTNQALAFLFIIFGQLANLAVLGLVFLGVWRFGKTLERKHRDVLPGKARESNVSGYSRDGDYNHDKDDVTV